jgi:glutamate synthase domain-containing protein 2
MIPEGTDAISPAPHHDIYSIEDLSQLIYALKEATDYSKPVGVKVSAVHNIAPIASGIVWQAQISFQLMALGEELVLHPRL